MTGPRTIRAPRGPNRTCRGWIQEAALRMLMNNLDPEVAERPQDLVVYGGTGKAARDWPSFDAICRTLDRKSTRLNSSHLVISYAVFCLKKKKKYTKETSQEDKLCHYL